MSLREAAAVVGVIGAVEIAEPSGTGAAQTEAEEEEVRIVVEEEEVEEEEALTAEAAVAGALEADKMKTSFKFLCYYQGKQIKPQLLKDFFLSFLLSNIYHPTLRFVLKNYFK
jgi:hypothetical protein